MNESILHRVREVVADVFGVPVEQIAPESSPDTIAAWDSLQHLNIVLALEQAFAIQFEPEEIEQMLSVELITMMVEEKQTQGQAGARP